MNQDQERDLDRNTRVENRARELWEQDGSQEGREMDYQQQAEQEVDAEGNNSGQSGTPERNTGQRQENNPQNGRRN